MLCGEWVTLTMTPFTHPKRTGSGTESLPGSPSASSGPASGRPLLCCRSDTGVRGRPGSGCGTRARQVRVGFRQLSLETTLWLSTQLETAGFSGFSQGLLGDVHLAQHQSWHQEAGDTVTHHRHRRDQQRGQWMAEMLWVQQSPVTLRMECRSASEGLPFLGSPTPLLLA